MASTVANAQPTEAAGLYKWFDTLGYGAITDGDFRMVQLWSGTGTLNTWVERHYCFRMPAPASKSRFLTLQLGLIECDNGLPGPWGNVGDGPAELASWAARRVSESGNRYPGRIVDSRGAEASPTELFLISRACAARGLTDLAATYFELARTTAKPNGVAAAVREGLAWAAAMRCYGELTDVSQSLASVLPMFEELTRSYAGTQTAKRGARVLAEFASRNPLSEVGQHPIPRGRAGSESAQIDALVEDLRDQPCQRILPTNIGNSFDFYAIDAYPDSPAARLVKYGFAAVPKLLEATKIQTLTRCVGFSRSGPFPLSVGAIAVHVLERIAETSFTESPFREDVEGSSLEAGARAAKWWEVAKLKGEFAVLSEGLRDSPLDAQRCSMQLIDRFPNRALQAISGAIESTSATRQPDLIRCLGSVQNARARTVISRYLAPGNGAALRQAAASALLHHDRAAGILTFCEQWNEMLGDPTTFDKEPWRLIGPCLVLLGTGLSES
ncbi:MAG TPA: hypothetical protein VKT78_15045, partial [Fimbriimonadaceae bacterium]|nr:hypothetical protein [Fimbriimonadaceae bacterium]